MKTRQSAALAASIASIFLAAACSSAPAQMTVHGTVVVPDNVLGAAVPVQDGSEVTVTDPSGKVIGFTTLDGNVPQGGTDQLIYGFTVRVPEGEPSYGITVNGLTGITQFTQKQMSRGPAICSGDVC